MDNRAHRLIFTRKELRLTCLQGRAPFDEGIVYVVGGGAYNEYQNLLDFCQVCMYVCLKACESASCIAGLPFADGAQRTGGRRLTYGSTTMMSAAEFLDDMARLGTPRS